MPHTLSDEETSLLLCHLLSHPAEPALVPIILSLHSSLVASRTGTASHSTTNTVELFHDFLGSPEDFNDWATPSLLDTSLPDPSLPDPLDDHYSVDVANFERFSYAISDYMLSCCDYVDHTVTSSTTDCGISPSLIFKDKIHEV